MSIAVAGFLLGLSLIVAIGPQNALVIRQGVKREGLIVVLAICMLSDIFLIFGGTAGVGVIIEKAPLALVALKWFGAAYLAWFAVSCFRDMVKPRALDSSPPIMVLRLTTPPRRHMFRTWIRPVGMVARYKPRPGPSPPLPRPGRRGRG